MEVMQAEDQVALPRQSIVHLALLASGPKLLLALGSWRAGADRHLGTLALEEHRTSMQHARNLVAARLPCHGMSRHVTAVACLPAPPADLFAFVFASLPRSIHPYTPAACLPACYQTQL